MILLKSILKESNVDPEKLPPRDKTKIKIYKKDGPGKRSSKLEKIFTHDEFVKEFGDKGVDYSRKLPDTVWNDHGLNQHRRYIAARNGSEAHPIHDLIISVEKRMNRGLTADEVDSAYPRMGQHNLPIFRIVRGV